MPNSLSNIHWRHDEPCSLSHQFCWFQLLFGLCEYQHKAQQLTDMHWRWGNLRHDINRELQAEGYKQIILGCQHGIHCRYLFRGLCRHKHSSFDKEFARRFRNELLKTKCSKGDDCGNNLCFYAHDNLVSIIVYENGKPMNKLVKKESLQQQKKKGVIIPR